MHHPPDCHRSMQDTARAHLPGSSMMLQLPGSTVPTTRLCMAQPVDGQEQATLTQNAVYMALCGMTSAQPHDSLMVGHAGLRRRCATLCLSMERCRASCAMGLLQ